jgi:hypothetical protein
VCAGLLEQRQHRVRQPRVLLQRPPRWRIRYAHESRREGLGEYGHECRDRRLQLKALFPTLFLRLRVQRASLLSGRLFRPLTAIGAANCGDPAPSLVLAFLLGQLQALEC